MIIPIFFIGTLVRFWVCRDCGSSKNLSVKIYNSLGVMLKNYDKHTPYPEREIHNLSVHKLGSPSISIYVVSPVLLVSLSA